MRSFLLICVGLVALIGPAAVGGGIGDEQGDENETIFFGVVKDTRGVAIANAVVTLELKMRSRSVITHTDVLGAYKIPTTMDPEQCELTCRKDGYRQVGTIRRTPEALGAKSPIEIDCTLQRGS